MPEAQIKRCHLTPSPNYGPCIMQGEFKGIQWLQTTFFFESCSSKKKPLAFFTESAPRPIQSISCNVCDLRYNCLSVNVWKPRLPVDWRLLVKKHITNMDIPLDILSFCCFNDFFYLKFFGGFEVFANQPTVHSGGVSPYLVAVYREYVAVQRGST